MLKDLIVKHKVEDDEFEELRVTTECTVVYNNVMHNNCVDVDFFNIRAIKEMKRANEASIRQLLIDTVVGADALTMLYELRDSLAYGHSWNNDQYDSQVFAVTELIRRLRK